MAQTSDITNLLQRFYTGKAEQTFSDEFWAHKEFDSVTNLKWEGENVRISIHTGRNDGAGAILVVHGNNRFNLSELFI